MTTKSRNKKKQFLLKTQGPICWLCGEPIEDMKREGTLDHYLPKSLGGDNNLSNLKLAHAVCNSTRSSELSPYSFTFFRARRRGWYRYPFHRVLGLIALTNELPGSQMCKIFIAQNKK